MRKPKPTGYEECVEQVGAVKSVVWLGRKEEAKKRSSGEGDL